MSLLSVHAEHSPEQPNKVLGHAEDIAATLAEVGVRFSQCDLSARTVVPFAGHSGQLEEQLWGGSEDSARAAEHSWPGAEQRLCLESGAQLCLHIGAHVYRLRCQAGDLLGLPAGIRQWFVSAAPQRLQRLGEGIAGWQLQPSGSTLAADYPLQDD